jgi:hypothetical protein
VLSRPLATEEAKCNLSDSYSPCAPFSSPSWRPPGPRPPSGTGASDRPRRSIPPGSPPTSSPRLSTSPPSNVTRSAVISSPWPPRKPRTPPERPAARADAQRQADAHTATQSVSGPVSAPAPAPRYSAEGSGACGGATNGADQFIGRETRGSADPVNQDNLSGSGAHGCYQITPSTWAASCGDLGGLAGSSAGTQARCASRLPLSAWAGG